VTPSARESAVPDFLVIGHVTRDLLPGGEWRLGGTVLYAAHTAARLDMRRVVVVTSGSAAVIAALRDALPSAEIAAVPAADATTFENVYSAGSRRQHLRGRAAPLLFEHVPAAWREARCVLLAPLAQEVDSALAAAFPRSLVAATPQGWLRRWDADGSVSPGPFAEADTILPHLDALILSPEDVAPPEAANGDDRAPLSAAVAEIIMPWVRLTPLILVTRGPAGALLLAPGKPPHVLPGYATREVDPTGAGDVFATAFLCELHASGDPMRAADFANRVAALSVEGEGPAAIPTRAEVFVRFG
jgi:1D-myo-inositol 3-kinase